MNKTFNEHYLSAFKACKYLLAGFFDVKLSTAIDIAWFDII
jgi:hypothetical protein